MGNQRILASAGNRLLAFQAVPEFDFEAAASDGKPKLPTFTINAYTGAPMNPMGFYTPVIVDLAGLKAENPTIPILLDHESSQIVGQATEINISSSGVKLAGTITGEDEYAQTVKTHAKNGFKWQASIGASIVRQEFLKAGETTTVNGRSVSGPLVIARESRLYETSFVAMGADSKTSATVAASNPVGNPEGDIPMGFDQWLKAKGFDPAALNDVQTASLKAAFQAEQAHHVEPASTATPTTATTTVQATTQANGPVVNPAQRQTLDDIIKAQREEDQRVQRITELTASAIRDRPMQLETFKQLAETAIEAKSSVNEFELSLLRVRANSAFSGPGVRTGGHDRIQTPKVLEAAMLRAGGYTKLEKEYDARTLEAADKQFRHGLGLQELILVAARENGYTGNSVRSDIESALRCAFVRASGGFSTISLPGILSNVANKYIIDAFNAVETAWRPISAIRPVQDFKQITSYSLTGDLSYEKVGAAGELKSGTLGELSYTNQADTYGKMLAITRKDIINDDLGAFMAIPRRMGRGAALKINDVFWTAFLAGVGTFWTSGRTNLISGGTTNLSSSSLDTATATFRNQTDPDGKPLGAMPRILLVPPVLSMTAAALMNSTLINTGGSATTAAVPNTNVWQGMYQIVSSTYLSNSSYTGYSTTAWFLLCDPNDIPTIEVAFLNGRETPIVESADAEFNTLGIQFRGYHDFGVSLQEYRGSLRSAGA